MSQAANHVAPAAASGMEPVGRLRPHRGRAAAKRKYSRYSEAQTAVLEAHWAMRQRRGKGASNRELAQQRPLVSEEAGAVVDQATPFDPRAGGALSNAEIASMITPLGRAATAEDVAQWFSNASRRARARAAARRAD